MPFAWIPRVSDLLPGAIKGLWTIGDVTTWHVELGTHPNDGSPSAGASGIRLYGADGVTVLIDLHIGGTPTITSAIVQTAASGRRLALSGPDNALELYSGSASETAPGSVTGDVTTNHIGTTTGSAVLKSPATAGVSGHAIVTPAELMVGDSNGNPLDVWGNSFRDPNGGYLPRWAGTTQVTLDAGNVSVTTDASGNVTVPHNLGTAPFAVIVNTGLSTTALIPETGTFTSTTFVLRLKTDTGAAFTGTLTIHYIAVG